MNKTIKKIIKLAGVAGIVAGTGTIYYKKDQKIRKGEELNKKNDAILKLFSKWMSSERQGKFVSDVLKKNGYKKIAIYGMHYLGERLYESLKDSEIEVAYVIDRNADNIFAEVDVYKPDEELYDVDAVIVTAFYFFDEIEESLAEQLVCPIVSLEDIINEM